MPMTANQRLEFDKLHPSLQMAMSAWMKKSLPYTGRQLRRGVPQVGGDLLTSDCVALHMASAAMTVLLMAVEAADIGPMP
jgi:hypothetical protein